MSTTYYGYMKKNFAAPSEDRRANPGYLSRMITCTGTMIPDVDTSLAGQARLSARVTCCVTRLNVSQLMLVNELPEERSEDPTIVSIYSVVVEDGIISAATDDANEWTSSI